MAKRKPDLTEFDAIEDVSELRAQIGRLEGRLRRAKDRSAEMREAVFPSLPFRLPIGLPAPASYRGYR